VHPYRHRLKTIFPVILVVSISLACSSLPRLGSSQEAAVRPTRTPLPTFTPTLSIREPLSILPTATVPPSSPPPIDTPVPAPEIPPTDTPAPAEPTATEPPPPPPPTEPPPPPAPTEPPPPAPSAQNGVEGKISFRDGRNTYAVGEKVFVIIEAKNVDSGLKSFAILGLTPSTGGFQTSWTNGSIAAGETFRWEDGVAFPAPGTHKLWLSICFSTEAECQGPDGNWVRFEPGLDVIVQ
jgi:hypothetical protein